MWHTIKPISNTEYAEMIIENAAVVVSQLERIPNLKKQKLKKKYEQMQKQE